MPRPDIVPRFDWNSVHSKVIVREINGVVLAIARHLNHVRVKDGARTELTLDHLPETECFLVLV